MGLLSAALIGGSVLSGVNTLLKSYLSDIPRTPFKGDLIDYFKINPSDFTLMITFYEEEKIPLLQLSLIQGLSYSLSRDVSLRTTIEAPFYFPIFAGRVAGRGVIQRIYTHPIEIPGYEENLQTVFSRWVSPERLMDSSFVLLLQKDTSRQKKGEEIYKFYQENASGNLLGDLKSFTKGLVKKVASNILKSINSVLPVVETLAILQNADLLKEGLQENIEGSFIDGIPVGYTFSSTAGNVACFEGFEFIVTAYKFDEPKEIKESKKS